MPNLYIMWLCALPFVPSKVSVDAFILLYYKLLLAKLIQFVFGAKFADWYCRLISICSRALFVTSVCRLLSLRG